MTNESQAAGFSGKKAALHAALTFVAVAAAGSAVAAALRVADPFNFGKAVGRAAAMSVGVALLASWLLQTRRRVAGWLVIVGFVGLFGAGVVTGLGRGGRDTPLTEAELKPPLEVERDGARWLLHRDLGFALRHPGGNLKAAAQPEIAALKGKGTAWSWVDPAAGEAFTLSVVKGSGASEEAFRAFSRGVHSGVSKQVRSLGQPPALEERFDWQKRTYGLEVALTSTSSYLRVRARAGLGRSGSTVVTATAVGKDRRFADVLESLGPDDGRK